MRRSLFRQSADIVNDFARPIAVANDPFHRAAGLFYVGRQFSQPMKTMFSIRDDTCQWLRYFMYYGRRQFTHGGDARYMGQLSLRDAECLLRALPLRHFAPQLLIGSHQFTRALHDAALQIVVEP